MQSPFYSVNIFLTIKVSDLYHSLLGSLLFSFGCTGRHRKCWAKALQGISENAKDPTGN